MKVNRSNYIEDEIGFDERTSKLTAIILFFLNCRSMFDEWTIELKAMADRIIHMRKQLSDALRARGELTIEYMILVSI